MTAAIHISDLNYTFLDGTVALEHVSFDIEKGESVTLAGPNGAGKSTLLLHLNGILPGKRSHESGKGSGYVEIFDTIIDSKRYMKCQRRSESCSRTLMICYLCQCSVMI